MSTASRLAKLAEGLDSNGVLSAAKGGTGSTAGGGASTPSAASCPDNKWLAVSQNTALE